MFQMTFLGNIWCCRRWICNGQAWKLVYRMLY